MLICGRLRLWKEGYVKAERKAPSKILLVAYPKVIFLYPTFVVSLAAAIYLSFVRQPLDTANTAAIVISVIFLGVWALNLVVLAFDFPRTSSLAVVFLLVAVAMGLVLLSVLKPEILPYVTGKLRTFHPLVNASFYWTFSVSLGLATLGAIVVARFNYWEARSNELLHHRGLWGDVDRFPSPGVRVDKEITDVFEYLLLQSGRLILHVSGERHAVALENVPFITRKEKALTHLLGTLQVAVHPEVQDVAE
jgi:lysylphosphatidylglycerol synthetase-like protein (DUF2156 family)